MLSECCLILALKSRTRIFAKYGIGGEMSIVTTFFILDYLQGKLLKIFPKNPKKTLFWDYFGTFLFKFGQKWIFVEKWALSVFK